MTIYHELLLLLLLLLLCFKLFEITLSARRHYLVVLLSLTMFLTVENIVLPFWKLLAYAC